jgi:hypothetical protein
MKCDQCGSDGGLNGIAVLFSGNYCYECCMKAWKEMEE